MEEHPLQRAQRFLAVLRVVGLAGFALSDPPIPAKVLAAAVLYVAAACALAAWRPRQRRLPVILLAGAALTDLAWLTGAFLHFGPLNWLPAVVYAGVVAGLTATTSWGVGVMIGCLGALVYYVLGLINGAAELQEAQRQLLQYQTAMIAIAGILGGYVSGQWSRLIRFQDLANRLRQLTQSTARMRAMTDDGAVLAEAVVEALDLLSADRAWMLLADEGTRGFRLGPHLGVTPPAEAPPIVPPGAGLAGLVPAEGEGLLASVPAARDVRLAPLERYLTQDHLAAAPLPGASDLLGVLMVSRRGGRSRFTPEDLSVLTMLGRSAGSVAEGARLIRRLRHAATTDSLTGLLNHGAFLEKLTEGVEAARERAQQLSLIVLDMDRFKRINDLVGHWEGNRVLRLLADALRQQCRSGDILGRCGGDEFAVLLPGNGPEEAAMVASRVAGALQRAGAGSGLPVICSASWGVACFPHDADDDAGLFRAADARLYASKQAPGEAPAAATNVA